MSWGFQICICFWFWPTFIFGLLAGTKIATFWQGLVWGFGSKISNWNWWYFWIPHVMGIRNLYLNQLLSQNWRFCPLEDHLCLVSKSQNEWSTGKFWGVLFENERLVNLNSPCSEHSKTVSTHPNKKYSGGVSSYGFSKSPISAKISSLLAR